MEQFVSKSAFKVKASEYLREVESTGKELVITDHGKPVFKIVPYAHDPAEALQALRGTVLRYDDPLEPVDLQDGEWPEEFWQAFGGMSPDFERPPQLRSSQGRKCPPDCPRREDHG